MEGNSGAGGSNQLTRTEAETQRYLGQLGGRVKALEDQQIKMDAKLDVILRKLDEGEASRIQEDARRNVYARVINVLIGAVSFLGGLSFDSIRALFGK